MRVERHIGAAEPAGMVVVRNQQRRQKIDLRMLRRIVRALAEDILKLETYEIRLTLVGSAAMAKLNQAALQHEGPTDVITFDLSDPLFPGVFSGDIFICPEEAVRQAKRFGVRWQTELVRYVVHAFLHLSGYDDINPEQRRQMKRAEDRGVKELENRLSILKLGKNNAPLSGVQPEHKLKG